MFAQKHVHTHTHTHKHTHAHMQTHTQTHTLTHTGRGRGCPSSAAHAADGGGADHEGAQKQRNLYAHHTACACVVQARADTV